MKVNSCDLEFTGPIHINISSKNPPILKIEKVIREQEEIINYTIITEQDTITITWKKEK